MLNSLATLLQWRQSLWTRDLASIHTIKESLNWIYIQMFFLPKPLLACKHLSTQLKTYFKPIWQSTTKCLLKHQSKLALRFAVTSLETNLQWSISINQWKHNMARGSSLTLVNENLATISQPSLLSILLKILHSLFSSLLSNQLIRRCFSHKEILKAKII